MTKINVSVSLFTLSLRGPLYNVLITMCVTYGMYGTKRDVDLGMYVIILQKSVLLGICSLNWALL